jgi:hypothetical protein
MSEIPPNYSFLHEKLVDFYCNFKQIKDIKDEISILKDSITELEQEKDDLEYVIIKELKSRKIEKSQYKDLSVKVLVKPTKEALTRKEKEEKILEIMEDNSIDIDTKIKNIFTIMKPRDTGNNIEKLSVRIKKQKDQDQDQELDDSPD